MSAACPSTGQTMPGLSATQVTPLPDPALSIIVPVHNRPALTRRCLDRVFETLPATPRAEVIVVDDGSDADTAALLRVMARGRLIRNPRPRGFAVSCNAGAAAARGATLVFLNSDALAHPGWLEALVACQADHPAAIIGAKLLHADGTIQHAGVVIGQDGLPWHLYAGFPADHPAVNRPRRFQAVTGACLLCPRASFEALGGFDESYLNGYEDVDLCLRAGELGLEVWYCPAAVADHLELGASERGRWSERNHRLFVGRWGGRLRPDDLDCYLEDGLLAIRYAQGYPVEITVSPQLATLDRDGADGLVEQRLAEIATAWQAQVRQTAQRVAYTAEPDAAPGSAAGCTRPPGAGR